MVEQQGRAAGQWDRQRIDAATAFIKARLDADFADTGLPAIEFRTDPGWSRESAPDEESGPPAEPGPEDVIVVCGGHEFPLGLQDGVEIACSDAAAALQDDVMDLAGGPWPELHDAASTYVGVLAPAAGPSIALAHWQLNDRPFCAVGQLRPACQSAGLTIKGHPTVR